MRLIVLLGSLALVSLLIAPTALAHPVQECGATGPPRTVTLWADAWAKDPIDEDGEGLHKFNSVGCYEERIQ